jgi:hypothetical protein
LIDKLVQPSDYLAHNHRVLCRAVEGWPQPPEADIDPLWSRREWSGKRFTPFLHIAGWLADRYPEMDEDLVR